MGHVLNYLSVDERLADAPSSRSRRPPYLNGGPDEYLSWVIEGTDMPPGTVATWLEERPAQAGRRRSRLVWREPTMTEDGEDDDEEDGPTGWLEDADEDEEDQAPQGSFVARWSAPFWCSVRKAGLAVRGG